MLKIVSVEQMRRIEAAADVSGYAYAAMMENAGQAAAQRALQVFAGRSDLRVTVLVGKGNNGGDGLVAARVIAQESSALVRCYLLGKRDTDPLLIAARNAGVHIANAEDDQGFRVLRQMISSAHLILDALFGIGIRLPLQGDAARLLSVANRMIREARAEQSGTPLPYILAVDCPSGLDCDTGALDPNTIPADETITFIAAKRGLFQFPGAGAVGKLTVATIDMPENLPELQQEPNVLVDVHLAHTLLPPRPINSHKGTYGTALIVGGSSSYRGAVGLSAHAAYTVGAGLVTVHTPASVVASLAGHILEATWLPQEETADLPLTNASALLIGPGWGQSQSNRDLLNRILAETSLPPLVIDADGLNLLAEKGSWWEQLPAQTILTPHPGEMSRLSGLSTADIQADRFHVAAQKAAQWNVILLLKGAHTLIAAPDGRTATLPFKTDALAKAGTGDVLAGAIVGFLAQGLEPFNAAVLGGYLHGLAGQHAAQENGTTRSVLAGQVAANLSHALMQVERKSVIET